MSSVCSRCWRCWRCRGVMRCVLFCIREAVEGGFFLLEVPKVPKVMRCVLRYMLETVEVGSIYGGVEGARGDALCALLYAGGSL